VRCPICFRDMQIICDTPLCLKCDKDVVEEFQIDIKPFLEGLKK
jgi:hypothetical protein